MAVPKGLKVGDTFKDYLWTYRVTKVIGDNYESERVEGNPLPSTPVEEGETDYNTMPYFELKKLCAQRGLNPNGKKEELIERLK